MSNFMKGLPVINQFKENSQATGFPGAFSISIEVFSPMQCIMLYYDITIGRLCLLPLNVIYQVPPFPLKKSTEVFLENGENLLRVNVTQPPHVGGNDHVLHPP